jgi:hypothetical protein
MAGMRLDIREEALKPTKSGITPIVPEARIGAIQGNIPLIEKF